MMYRSGVRQDLICPIDPLEFVFRQFLQIGIILEPVGMPYFGERKIRVANYLGRGARLQLQNPERGAIFTLAAILVDHRSASTIRHEGILAYQPPGAKAP